MRVLFVVPAYDPFIGGAQTFVREMACRLARSGDRVTVLTTNARQAGDFWRPSEHSPLPWREQITGVQIIRLSLGFPVPAPYTTGVLRRLSHAVGRSKVPVPLQSSILRQFARFLPTLNGLEFELHACIEGADVVHVIDGSWDGLLARTCQSTILQDKGLLITPLIHTGSARIQTEFTMPHQLKAYQDADFVTALSQMEADLLQENGVRADRCVVLPMGVDPVLAEISAEQTAAFRRRHGIDGPVVAFIGAATFDKGATVLARAVAKLLKQGENLWLVCAGTEQQRLQAAVDQFPAEDQAVLARRMVLLGVVDEQTKATILAICSLLALPSRVDSFGIVALEAALFGKPVIAAAAGGLQETVRHNETGLHVPFGDVDALADAIQKIVRVPGLADSLGRAGQRRTLAGFTWENTLQELQTLYRKALHDS